jgi:hypothetical protein
MELDPQTAPLALDDVRIAFAGSKLAEPGRSCCAGALSSRLPRLLAGGPF